MNKRINCWAHALRNVDTEIAKIKHPKYKVDIRDDICSMQLCYNEALFSKASELWKIKWNKQNNVSTM